MMTKRSNHMPTLMNSEDEHQRHRSLADLLEPEQLRREDVAADHDPVGPGERPDGAVHEHELLVLVAGVPGDEELGGVGQCRRCRPCR